MLSPAIRARSITNPVVRAMWACWLEPLPLGPIQERDRDHRPAQEFRASWRDVLLVLPNATACDDGTWMSIGGSWTNRIRSAVDPGPDSQSSHRPPPGRPPVQIGITYLESMAQGSPVAHAAGSDPQVEIVMGKPIGMIGVSAARLAPCAPTAARRAHPETSHEDGHEGAGHDLVQPRVSAHRFPRSRSMTTSLPNRSASLSAGSRRGYIVSMVPVAPSNSEPPIDAARPTQRKREL